MPTWLQFVAGYAVYLVAVAWSAPGYARARRPALVILAASVVLAMVWPRMAAGCTPSALAVWVAVPGLFLLATYRVSGAFFTSPNLPLERALLRIDDAALVRIGILGAYESAALLRAVVELLYLMVYAMVPLGAAVLVLGARADMLERFWAVVFAAELACYAMLPWLQTRPPRALEGRLATHAGDPLRRLNLAVLQHGSIQVNTLPSAHAAGAIAVALVMIEAMPVVGSLFLAVAIGITIATVLGRYHYLADALLGAVVAVGAWLLAAPR